MVYNWNEFINEEESLSFFENSLKQLNKIKSLLWTKMVDSERSGSNIASFTAEMKSKVDEIEKYQKEIKDLPRDKRRELVTRLINEVNSILEKVNTAEKEAEEKEAEIKKKEGSPESLLNAKEDANTKFQKARDLAIKMSSESAKKAETTKTETKEEFEIKTGQTDKELSSKDPKMVDKIKNLQSHIIGKGDKLKKYLEDKGAPNGIYGKRTTSTIKLIQKSLGLKDDGILTASLYSKIMNESSKVNNVLIFEEYLFEDTLSDKKIDWKKVEDLIGKDTESQKEISRGEIKKSIQIKPKTDEKTEAMLKEVGEFKTEGIKDPMRKVISLGGSLRKTDKGNQFIQLGVWAFYKNGACSNIADGDMGTFDINGVNMKKSGKIPFDKIDFTASIATNVKKIWDIWHSLEFTTKTRNKLSNPDKDFLNEMEKKPLQYKKTLAIAFSRIARDYGRSNMASVDTIFDKLGITIDKVKIQPSGPFNPNEVMA